MTDYPKALAALREARDENASTGHAPVSWFLVDAALDALDAARGQAGGEPSGYESTTSVYKRYVSPARYAGFSPAVQRWYRPYWTPAPPAAAVPACHNCDGGGTFRGPFGAIHQCPVCAPPAALAVPAANVTPMRQPRTDLARLVESINAAVYANGDGLSVTEAIGALELAKLELLKEQEQ